jgi:hypothetical protein
MMLAARGGWKTQTRRVVRVQPELHRSEWHWRRTKKSQPLKFATEAGLVDAILAASPYGQPDDRLWGRETWYCDHFLAGDYEATSTGIYVNRVLTRGECEAEWRGEPSGDGWLNMYYRADGEAHQQFEQLEHATGRIWHPSIHMPRWACRTLADVLGLRVHRLQSITPEDALAEGVSRDLADHLPDDLQVPYIDLYKRGCYVACFELLWDSINGERPGCAWRFDPWVYAATFKMSEQPATKEGTC